MATRFTTSILPFYKKSLSFPSSLPLHCPPFLLAQSFWAPIILVIFYVVSQDGSLDGSATFSMLTIRDFLVAWIIQFTYSFSAAIVFSIRRVNTLYCWHRGRQRDLCACCDLEQVNRVSCRLKCVLAWDLHYGGGSLWLRPLSFFGVGESL